MGKTSQIAINLRPRQEGLLQLSDLAGLHMDPTVAKIIVELLNMQVKPEAIIKMLRTVGKNSRARRSLNQTRTSTSP